MTNKEAAWHLGTYSTTMGSGQTTDEQHNEAKRIAIKALEQEPKTESCEDCISRQAVLDLLEDTNNGWIINEVSQLPPVKPQSKTGHWVMRHRKVNTINYRTGEDVLTGEIHTVKELIRYETDEPYCACCGKRAEDISQDYCGYCGARMEVEQNG